MTGRGTAVPSCVAVIPVPGQSLRSDGTVTLRAQPSPRRCVSPDLAAGNTQTLECYSSRFRTSLLLCSVSPVKATHKFSARHPTRIS